MLGTFLFSYYWNKYAGEKSAFTPGMKWTVLLKKKKQPKTSYIIFQLINANLV